MKKTIFSFAVIMMMLTTVCSYAQSAHNDNYYKGQANSLLSQCLADFHPTLNINSYVVHDETSCLNRTTVFFYGTPKCPGNMYCITVVYPLGSVTFECNDEPVVIACGSGATF